jgi:hypothetical protein
MCAAALWVVGVSAGCAKKSDELTETTTATDSLLASNPVESPEGNLAPQNEYQPPPEPVHEEPAPAPAPPRRSSSASRPAPAPPREPASPGVTLEAGTNFNVGVSSQISSETSNPGDLWTGEVKEAVIVGNTVVIPAGSQVTGVVTGVQPAARGNRAFLVLGVQSVTVNGKSMDVSAATDSIVAGSPRARNLGAIAGGAAAGALIGKAVGGSGKGALIGGLIGGAAATGAVAKSKGYQVVVKEGTVLDFTVNRNVKVHS